MIFLLFFEDLLDPLYSPQKRHVLDLLESELDILKSLSVRIRLLLLSSSSRKPDSRSLPETFLALGRRVARAAVPRRASPQACAGCRLIACGDLARFGPASQSWSWHPRLKTLKPVIRAPFPCASSGLSGVFLTLSSFSSHSLFF